MKPGAWTPWDGLPMPEVAINVFEILLGVLTRIRKKNSSQPDFDLSAAPAGLDGPTQLN
ncbi:MAG: hypothetical protein RBT11_15580 [Desulfobacterales bacterium]|jgi:hypothetical protein|nr:hypothetical protein [Desulfobacterales bacterium]